MSPSHRSQQPAAGRLYMTALALVVVGIVTVSGSALYVTAGGNLFGMGAATFGIVAHQVDDTEATLQRARQAAWSGRHAAAIAAYDTVMARRPTDRDVALERARVLAWAGRYGEAADALGPLPALPGDPSDVAAAVQRARYLWWADRAREADSLLSVVLTEHPDVAEAVELQALIRPSVEPALEVTKRWVTEQPEDPWSNLWLARALVANGRSGEALAPYRQAMAEPGTVGPDILLEAAGVALGVDSLAFAGRALERYLRDVDPPDWQTRLRLARAYSWSGRYTAADGQYRIVLEQAPSAAVRLELARMLAGAGRYDAAAAELGALLGTSESVELLAELARVRMLAARFGEAADLLARALEQLPEDQAVRLERARYLWWAGRMEAADAELTRLLAAVPDHAEALALRDEVRPGIDPSVQLALAWLAEQDSRANRLLVARALVQANRHAEALEHYAAALADATDRELVIEAADVADAAGAPDRMIDILERHLAAADAPAADMRLRLARSLAWAGRHDDAARMYGDYLAARPEDAGARFERARQLAWGDSAGHAEAGAELTRLVAAEPAHAEALKLLGDLARWRGEYDVALDRYRRAAAADPSLDSLEEGVRLALELRAAQLAPQDATVVAWAVELDAFTDTEGFDWVGSSIRREWRFGESALTVRLGQGYSRGRPLAGADLGAMGLGAVLGGRLAVAPGLSLLGELGAMSYQDIDAFVTWGAGMEYEDETAWGRLRYGRSPAVREAATMAALQAGAIMDRLHVEGSRDLGRWHAATDLQLQRFGADAGSADRYAAMVRVDRELGETGVAMGGIVRGIFATDRAPSTTQWGRLYWTPDHYVAPALSVRYGATIAEGVWLGLRAAPGIAFIDEGEDGVARYTSGRTAILETGATVGYRNGPWSVELSGDWGGALPDGYHASSLRFQLARLGGPR